MSLNKLVHGVWLSVLLGCAASAPVDRTPSSHEGDVAAEAHDKRPGAPVLASLRGPEAPVAGELLALEARIERKRALNTQVEVELVLPPGVVLVEGDRLATLSPNTQAQTDTLRYVIRAEVLPESEVRLLVRARSQGFGLSSAQSYRFGRARALPPALPHTGKELRVGDKSFGRSVDITPTPSTPPQK